MADLAHILKKTEQRSKALPKSKQVVRIADGPRPYEEEAKAFARELDAKNQPGTTAHPTGDNKASNRGQELDLSPVDGVSPSDREHSATELSEIGLSTGDKSMLVPGSIGDCPRLDEPLSPVVKTINRGQTESQPGTRQVPTGDISISNRGQPLPSSRQQLLILSHLIAVQEATGLGHTQRLSRAELAASLNVTCDVLKRQLQRMINASIVVRLEAKDGRHEGGTVYQISRETVRAFGTLNRGQPESQPGTKTFLTGDNSTFNRGHQPGTNPTLVSSSDLKYTTTTDKDLAQRFQLACERFGLHDAGVGANDILQVWRKGIFQTEEDFLTSLEHIAFYLGTAEAKTLKHPKAWVTSQLSKGFYPAPVGFVSWEERQQEAQLKAKRERLARLEELKRQESDADFELWFAEASETELRAAVSGTPFIERLRSPGAKAVAKEWFSTNRQERA